MKRRLLKNNNCLLCGGISLLDISSPIDFCGVTSDCKPWPMVGEFAACASCGHVQKRLTDAWFSDIKDIYSQYEMYPLSDGNEQVIFSEAAPVPRTEKLLSGLKEAVEIPQNGRLLDIGCGNGAFLRTFGRMYKEWDLFGYEQNNTCDSVIRNIERVGDFYSGSIDDIEGRFDMISMIYVIEHLTEPVKALKAIRPLLKPGGFLFIQTSDFKQNPFDLMVVDHCSHFHFEALEFATMLGGFETLENTHGWIAKEIGLVAKPSDVLGSISKKNIDLNCIESVKLTLSWLSKVVEQALEASEQRTFGIFGTALAGTWLAKTLGDRVSFFVDEDPLRKGKTHVGHKVFSPGDIVEDASVYMAFPPELARGISRRLQHLYPLISFVNPPKIQLPWD